MPKKSKKRGNRSITTHRKKYKVSSKSVTTTNVQPLPSQPSPVQQVTVDNGDSSTITSNVESTNTSTNQSPTVPSILLPPLLPPLQPSVSLHEPTPPPLITPVPPSPTPPTPTPPLNEVRSGTQLNQAPIPAVSMSSSDVDDSAYDQDTDDEDATQLDSKPSPVPSSCTSGNIEVRLKKEEDAYDMDTDNEDIDDEEEGSDHKYKTEKHRPVKKEEDTNDK